MYHQKRGKVFSFVYYDSETKKNIRLSKDCHPVIQMEREAIEFCRQWNARNDSMKVRAQKKMEWSTKYHNFNDLLKKFEWDRREEASYSWEDNLYQVRYYVFPFFLEMKKENNLNQWYYHFEEFRDYLKTATALRSKIEKKTLSYSTMNAIIKSLNAFIKSMYRRREVDRDYKCRLFNASKLQQRSFESVLDPLTQKRLFEKMRERNLLMFQFLKVSLSTGLRLNEQVGVSLSDFILGEPESPFIRKSLSPYRLKIYGYLTIDSQPSLNRQSPREDQQKVPRKPLKGKKNSDLDQSRIIPIFDKEVVNILVSLWNEQRRLYERKRFGFNPKDYLLFDGLNKNIYSAHLREAQKALQFQRFYTPHDMRHTYATWIAEKTRGNYAVCRMILGHASIRMTLRYVHLHAKLRMELKSKNQLLEEIKEVA